MSTVLITGAGRGLGAEFARQFLTDGWHVIGTARDLAALDDGAGYQRERLDVSDDTSVAALAKTLGGTAIDVLLNNAGINLSLGVKFGSHNYDDWLEEYRINTLAPLRVAEGLVEHVARSERKQMVFISSQTGSNTRNTASGSPGYRASKAALNSGVRSVAVELAPRAITCVLMHPGWVQTDMGGSDADLDMSTSIQGVRGVIENLTPADNGRFLNYDGSEIPW
jgi:NAD(P)-dependent dehydrogenase (short-subunit alcohol dehydrogenase family)